MNRMLEYKSLSLDLKALDDKSGEFTGYTTKFNDIDRELDVIMPGAYDRTIAEHKAANTLPSLFWNHKPDLQCGDITEVTVDKVGVVIKGVVWKGQGIDAAERAWRMLKGTGVKALSTGMIVKGKSKTPPQGSRRAITDIDWLESSLTSVPMLKSALITDVKSLESLSEREAEDILRDVGMSHTEAKAFIGLLKKGFQPPRDEDAEIRQAMQKLRSYFTSK